MKIKSVDKHLKELLKDPVFKKEYLKDKKRLKGVIKNMKDRERKIREILVDLLSAIRDKDLLTQTNSIANNVLLATSALLELFPKELSVEEIYDIISLSCVSQIKLVNSVNRAIRDMKDLAKALHERIYEHTISYR